MNPWVDFSELIWQNDFSGEDMGYDEIDVVGIYMHKEMNIMFDIDMNTMKILSIWEFSEED